MKFLIDLLTRVRSLPLPQKTALALPLVVTVLVILWILHAGPFERDLAKTLTLVGILLFFVILFLGFCYAIYRITPYLEGFQQYGYIGAFLVAFISSATVIFPMPGIVIVLAIAASPVFNTALVALAAGVGTTLGETTAY